MKHPILPVITCIVILSLALGTFFACTQASPKVASRETLEATDASLSSGSAPEASDPIPSSDSIASEGASSVASESADSSAEEPEPDASSASGASSAAEEREASEASAGAEAVPSSIDIVQDQRPSFVHGEKGASHQKYIVLHDTEGDSSPSSVIDYWDGNGNLVAAHFVVGKDGTVVQAVPLDSIAHHAGYGDAGHNALYGIADDGRDDMLGTVPIGDWAPDYGMNAWSVGIEMVHVGGSGYYPEEQLAAVDALIAYIDDYYGFESQIIDHKAWRSGNSDTSPEFADYLANYQDHRTHL